MALADGVLGPLLGERTRQALLDAKDRAQAVALLIASPEFQRRYHPTIRMHTPPARRGHPAAIRGDYPTVRGSCHHTTESVAPTSRVWEG